MEIFSFPIPMVTSTGYLRLIEGFGLYAYKFLGELVFLARGIDEFTEVEVMLYILVLIDI